MHEYWLTVGAIGLVTAAVALWNVSRNIRHRAVIEERQKWRDTIRELVPQLIAETDNRERKRIRNSILLRLNPFLDQTAKHLIDAYLENPSDVNENLVIDQFQEILKRDWERAKIEASHAPWFARSRASKLVEQQVEDSM